jgi:hypothetical protein
MFSEFFARQKINEIVEYIHNEQHSKIVDKPFMIKLVCGLENNFKNFPSEDSQSKCYRSIR